MHVRVGKEVVEASTVAAVFVPHGTPHTYWNPGPDPVRYLLIMTANIYHLIQEIHAMKERTPAMLLVVFAKYDAELLDEYLNTKLLGPPTSPLAFLQTRRSTLPSLTDSSGMSSPTALDK